MGRSFVSAVTEISLIQRRRLPLLRKEKVSIHNSQIVDLKSIRAQRIVERVQASPSRHFASRVAKCLGVVLSARRIRTEVVERWIKFP